MDENDLDIEYDIYEQLLMGSLLIERNIESQSMFDTSENLPQEYFSNEKIHHVDVCDVDPEIFYSLTEPSLYISLNLILILIFLVSLIWKLIKRKKQQQQPQMNNIMNFECWRQSMEDYQRTDLPNLIWTNKEQLMTKLNSIPIGFHRQVVQPADLFRDRKKHLVNSR